MPKPEETIESAIVYTGRRIRVRKEKVVLPNGVTAQRDIIEHPSAVCIVALDDQMNVLMVRQYRKAIDDYLLEVPAGAMDHGSEESPLECARRELREETGHNAKHFVEIGRFWTTPGFTTELMYAYMATGLTAEALPPDEDEQIDVERIPLKELVHMARTGKLNDGKSLASILLVDSRITGSSGPPVTQRYDKPS